MHVHHLNCATMCPKPSGLVNEHGQLVCHCLLVELPDRLVLVETGLGTDDVLDPSRLGMTFRLSARPRLDLAETAVTQIAALGFDAGDVTDIVVTHLDLDHAGGLADFPAAAVHVHQAELETATRRRLADRGRYRPDQFAHGPRWAPVDAFGEEWFGFESVRPLPDLDQLVMVPLIGHSAGHTAVGLCVEGHWLLHCGDAYFHHREVDPVQPWCSPGLRLFQRFTEADRRTRVHNQERLRSLRRDHGHTVTLLSAHDPSEFHQHTS